MHPRRSQRSDGLPVSVPVLLPTFKVTEFATGVDDAVKPGHLTELSSTTECLNV